MQRLKRILKGFGTFLIGMIAWAMVPFLMLFDLITYPIIHRKKKKD